MRPSPRAVVAVALAVAVACVLAAARPQTDSTEFRAGVAQHVKHVVIVVQENRSFDNLFYGYPGADTATDARISDGRVVPLVRVSLGAGYDLDNRFEAFLKSVDDGRMDGYDLRTVTPRRHAKVPLAALQFPALAYVPASETKPYRDMAAQYVLADRMFPSNFDQSFAAHLYLVAGTAARAVDTPNGKPWGCDAKPETRVALLSLEAPKVSEHTFPCFIMRTLVDELDEQQRPWRYYAPLVSSGAAWTKKAHDVRHHIRKREPGFNVGQLWSAFDAIAPVRYGPDWDYVVSPPARVIADIRRGDLGDVTWVVPDYQNSDHPLAKALTGPSWVAAVVNAIGRSPMWKSTAIVVLWDDSGGWYDHVPPPRLDFDGLGVRVPMLLISPYAKRGYVSHQQFEFGSVLRLVEAAFSLQPLAASDRRAADLSDCFDFSAAPRPFVPIAAPHDEGLFVRRQRPSRQPPDND